ncbi:hypothetical protein [Deinococcus sp. UYEF24]
MKQPSSNRTGFMPPCHWNAYEELFSVQVPVGVGVLMDSSGGGNGQWAASASLMTNLSVSELLDGFDRDLASRSWTERARTSGREVSSASWTNEQGGMIVITLRPTQDGFSAQLIMARGKP